MVIRPWLHFSDAASVELYEADEDCFDALVASLVARAHATGLCEPIPAEFQHEAEVEGWIALPRRETLDLLPRGHHAEHAGIMSMKPGQSLR